jgi:hypothetical protein
LTVPEGDAPGRITLVLEQRSSDPAERYEFADLIAVGGMGDVYAGRDRRLDRDVAIKTMRDPTDERARARFVAEARAAARITHPNVVTVYDVIDDDEPRIVMERLPGRTLADAIAAGPLPIAEAMAATLDVLAALEAVHAAGLVHRDVKPGNVLLAADGRAKLADFGIAWTPASDLTSTGEVVGTAAYVAPERLHGQPPSARTDVYSAGVMLGRALGGTDIPPTVAATLEQATAFDAVRRHPSARALRDALVAAAAADGIPVEDRLGRAPLVDAAEQPTEALALDAPTAVLSPPTAVLPAPTDAGAEPATVAAGRSGAGARHAALVALVTAALVGGAAFAASRTSGGDGARTEPSTTTQPPATTVPETTVPETIATVAPPPTAPPKAEKPARPEKPPKGHKGKDD